MTPNRDGSQRDAGPGLKLVLENWALRFLLIGLISLVFFSLGIGKWLATNLTTNSATQDDINHFFGEIGFAFTIAAFLILTTERNAKRELHSQFSQCMDLIRAEFRQSLQRFSSVESISSFLYRVHSGVNNKEIQALADDIFNEYTTELFIVEGDGFAIADRNWAMEANKKFYAMLLRSTFNIADFEVRVTHSGSIKIWEDEDEGRASLTQQRDFILQKKARIIRIFVGTANSPSNEYKRVMKMMSDYGISTYYVQRDHPERVLDMTWVPALELQMTWSMRPGGNVARINISSDARGRDDLDATWKSLMEQAKGPQRHPGPSP